jgi:hypothetical protein
MLINFNRVFKNLIEEGEPELQATKTCVVVDEKHNFVRPEGVKEGYTMIQITVPNEQVTLKSLSLNLLFSDLSENDQKKVSPEEKSKRFLLAMKIKEAKDGVVDLKSEEITEIKKLIGIASSPMVLGQAEKFLEDVIPVVKKK